MLKKWMGCFCLLLALGTITGCSGQNGASAPVPAPSYSGSGITAGGGEDNIAEQNEEAIANILNDSKQNKGEKIEAMEELIGIYHGLIAQNPEKAEEYRLAIERLEEQISLLEQEA